MWKPLSFSSGSYPYLKKTTFFYLTHIKNGNKKNTTSTLHLVYSSQILIHWVIKSHRYLVQTLLLIISTIFTSNVIEYLKKSYSKKEEKRKTKSVRYVHFNLKYQPIILKIIRLLKTKIVFRTAKKLFQIF